MPLSEIARILLGFLDRLGNLGRFAHADTDLALAVARDYERGEAAVASALDDFTDPARFDELGLDTVVDNVFVSLFLEIFACHDIS